MKNFFAWYAILLKRQLKKKSFLILMFAVPVITIVCSNLSAFKTESIETVMIYAMDNDESTQRIIQGILKLNTEFKYVLANSSNELKQNVLSRKALCGFIFKPNLSQKLKNEKYSNNVEYFLRQDSVFSDAACEQIYSKYLKEMSFMLAQKIIKDSTGVSENSEGFNLRADYEEFMRQDETEFLSIVFLDENPKVDIVSNAGYMMFSISGVMALIMLLGAFLGTGTLITDCKNGVLVSAVRGRENFIRLIYIQIPVMLLSISTFFTLWASKRNVGLGNIFVSVLIYSLLLIIIAFVFSFFVKTSSVLLALEVVVILSSLILCPIFFDFSSIIPVVKTLRNFLPPQWLLNLL